MKHYYNNRFCSTKWLWLGVDTRAARTKSSVRGWNGFGVAYREKEEVDKNKSATGLAGINSLPARLFCVHSRMH